jgi:SAM-dependent methyltransferase
MQFANSYDDAGYAAAYSKLDFPNTYYLAFRDLPAIINQYVHGKKALDFGCGSGRSTRFLRRLGFDVVGVDISEEMIRKAAEIDPAGRYTLTGEKAPLPFDSGDFHLVLSCFTFDNIPTREKKVRILRSLRKILAEDGMIINLVSNPEIYTHEWASFSTRDFPENRRARSGDRVKIIVTDLDDRRPVEDIIWTGHDYLETYQRSGLIPVQTHRPLATGKEPYVWINETRIPPWSLYVLRREETPSENG